MTTRRAAGAGVAPGGLEGRIVSERFRLEQCLGSGAMGTVYRARHLLIDREVAIKILDLRRIDPLQGRSWFLREARAVNRVRHANTVEIHDYGETEDGLVYLVMELLLGDRLSERIAAGPRPQAWSLEVIEQIAAALARAHDLGVVHCDLKPDHVFLVDRAGRRDFVKLIDFGLARIPREGRLAAPGTVLGTPEYLSPEQARGEDAGPQSDLYSLGVVLFEMLTGRLPFEREEIAELLECHRRLPPPDPRALRDGLDPGVVELVQGLLAKDLGVRFRDAHHVVDSCKDLQARLDPPIADFAEPTPPLRPSGSAPREGVSGWAARAAGLWMSCAAAYPGGGEPAEVRRELDEAWRLVAALARLEGELQVLVCWDENQRARAEEHEGYLGRRIEELSRASSRLRRDVARARAELDRLEGVRREAERDLVELREVARLAEDAADDATLRSALEAAGQAAAAQQQAEQASVKVEARVEKWLRSAAHNDQRSEILRTQLARHADVARAALSATRPRVRALVGEHQATLSQLAELETGLAGHFAKRPECRALGADAGTGTLADSGIER